MLKFIISLFLLVASSSMTVHEAWGTEEFEVFTDNTVYSDGSPLLVYGTAEPGQPVIVRLVSPDENIAKFDQIAVGDDGTFSYLVFMWPDASIQFPYGTYTVEVISSAQNGLSKKIDIKFLSTEELATVPIERSMDTMVFVPESAAVDNPMRIFVQTTSDGMLVGQDDPDKLLQTSHVHLPNGNTEDISDMFLVLHNGLYFADYVPRYEGTYVFHISSFNQGIMSHGFAATSVISQDLGGISDEIDRLNEILDETSKELETLKSEVGDFKYTLGDASTGIDDSVRVISSSVQNTEEASAQLNSLLFPIVASIGIIVALQIAILARKR